MSFGYYSPILIILSLLIGMISSYTALALVERISDSNKTKEVPWVLYGSFILGLGIFSMHFIGMIAYHMDMPLTYHPLLLFVSLFVAILASFAVLYSQSKSKINVYIGGLIIGAGIVLMHHIAMISIIDGFKVNIKSIYFTLSIVIALLFSTIALKIFYQGKESQTTFVRKSLSAVILGTGISFMHYTGMKATVHVSHSDAGHSDGIGVFALGLIVSLIVLIILIVTIFLVVMDLHTLTSERQLVMKIKESEERFRRLLELSPEPIVVHNGKEIVFVNEAALKMTNVSDRSELLGKSIIDYVSPAFKEVVSNRIQQMIKGFKAQPLEEQIVTPDGSLKYLEITGIKIEFEGKPAIQLVVRDMTEQKRINRDLEENRQRYKSLFNQNPDGIYSMDRHGNLMNINKSLEKILGYSIEELTKMTFHTVVNPRDLDMTVRNFEKALEGIPQNYETVGIHKNGQRIPLNITNMPIIVDEEIIGVYGIAKDVSKEKEALRLLEDNEEKYRSLFDHNLDAVFELNLDGTINNINKMAEELTSYSREELYNMSFPSTISSDLEEAYKTFDSVKEGIALHVEQKLKGGNGSVIEADVSVVPIRKQGEVDGVFSIVRDVTEKNRIQKRINELAFTDQLTGLPNRHWFYKNFREVIKRAKELKQTIAILTVDFDDFKTVNDLLGHQGGDLFLQQVSSRIKSCLRENDNVSRLGGDEFIIVLEDVTEGDVIKLARRILQAMNPPILLLEHEIRASLSIGISMNLDHTIDDETFIRQADIALYSAKEQGKNNYQFFTEELNKKVKRKSLLENALRKAIEQQELQLFYQPQVDLVTEELVGLEALIRWNSPFGLVSPAEFIPIAEDTGLILPIGEWVIKETCRQIKKWEIEGRPKIKISVNVSARQFKDSHFGTKVKNILEEEKVDPHFLEIEITESVMLNLEESSRLIQELKKMGMKIAIDDFGAGYSSLNVIKNVEIDTLKIDKSLIDDVIANSRNMSILTAIIGVGHSLHTQVIVEGIETMEQADVLKKFRVVGQGYYYSRPFPPNQMDHVWKGQWSK